MQREVAVINSYGYARHVGVESRKLFNGLDAVGCGRLDITGELVFRAELRNSLRANYGFYGSEVEKF